VVQAQITSISRRMQVRVLPAMRVAVAQMAEQRKNTWAVYSRRRAMPGWCSTGIVLSPRSADEPPQPCSIIPPGLSLAGANRVPVGGSRRGWRRRPQATADRKGLHARVSGARTEKLGVVKAQGYFAWEREVVGSIPTWHIPASSSMDRAPNVPGRMFPSSSFSRAIKGARK
jgi:hypothetical protein